MSPKPPFYFVLLFLLMEASPATPQEIFFNKVLPPEGKTFVHVSGIVQDMQGYMWFATKKGLFRYDGYRMTSYKHNPADTNSLSTDALDAICIDATGILWIGTLGNGLERFDPSTGIFTHFRPDPKDPESLSSNWIWAVLEDQEGTLWVGTANGLDRFDSQRKKFIHFRNQPDNVASISCNEVRAIYEDKVGTLWIGTGNVYAGKEDEGGLNRMDKKAGTFIRYLHEPKDPLSLINNKVRAIFEDSKGNFWVGTAGDGLHTMDRKTGKFQRHLYDPAHPEKLSRPPYKKKSIYDHITFITEDVSGAIWIGTAESGLNHYDPPTETTKHYELEKDTAGAFSDGTAWWSYNSKDGNVWIGTLWGNLYRINPHRQNIPYYESLDGSVKSICEEADGSLWRGTQKGLQFQHKQAENEIIRFVNDPGNPASLSNNSVEVIKKDRQGNIWVGTQDGLNLLDKNKGTFTRYRHDAKNNNSLSSDYILAIYEDRQSDLWIGTAKGLNRMNRKTGSIQRFIFHAADTGSVGSFYFKNAVSSVLEDRQGHIWVACAVTGDVHRLNPANGKFTTFLNGMRIPALFEDADGILWTGGDEGLFQYNRTTDAFVPFIDSRTHTEFSFIRSIIEDEQRNLWLGSANGIFKLNPQRIVSRVYGKSHGVNGNDLRRQSYKGTNGKIFFGTYSGSYFVFLPDQLTKDLKPPQIVISDFRLVNKLKQSRNNDPLQEPVSLVKEIRLNHNQNAFSFEFAAIDYNSPEDNRHFFMLENYDDGWNKAGSEHRALYYNVPPGKYVFRVKGANSDGIWAEKSIDVIIIPPWWSTWWFRATAVLCVVALLYTMIRWRMHQKFRKQLEYSKKEKQLAELQQQKTELEMQALRAQMNPHFIFNCLNSINRFVLRNDTESASNYLTKFSKLMRMVLENSKQILIPLEEEVKCLELYIQMEQFRCKNAFIYYIKCHDGVNPEEAMIPPLLLQPFVENAIWHGVNPREGDGNIGIDFFQKEEALYCVIKDNGIGRKMASELKSQLSEHHKSMGLQITKERLAIMGQQQSKESTVNIEDLSDESGKAAGTKVTIRIFSLPAFEELKTSPNL